MLGFIALVHRQYSKIIFTIDFIQLFDLSCCDSYWNSNTSSNNDVVGSGTAVLSRSSNLLFLGGSGRGGRLRFVLNKKEIAYATELLKRGSEVEQDDDDDDVISSDTEEEEEQV